jgi:mRNA interferase MazF
MSDPGRGEVWIVDLGMVAKIRPCLVLSVAPGLQDRALVTVVIHTTQPRGSRFEVSVKVPFLKAGAFDAQDILTIPKAKFIRRKGSLTPAQLGAVEAGVRAWLGF